MKITLNQKSFQFWEYDKLVEQWKVWRKIWDRFIFGSIVSFISRGSVDKWKQGIDFDKAILFSKEEENTKMSEWHYKHKHQASFYVFVRVYSHITQQHIRKCMNARE